MTGLHARDGLPGTEAIPRAGGDTETLPAASHEPPSWATFTRGSAPRSFPALPDEPVRRHANDPFTREPVSVPAGKRLNRHAVADNRKYRDWLTSQKDETTSVVQELQPCRCDDCKYGQQPGKGVVLYIGPDAIQLQIEQAHRDGRYLDTEAAFDEVQIAATKAITAAERKAHKAIDRGWRQIRRVSATSNDSRWLRDDYLGEQLRRVEDRLAAQLAAMREAAEASKGAAA